MKITHEAFPDKELFFTEGCVEYSRFTDAIEAGAFENPDGSVAVVLLNRTDSDNWFCLTDGAGESRCFTLPAHSIVTVMM